MRVRGLGIAPVGVVVCLLIFPFLAQGQSEEKFIGEVRVMNVVEVECTRQEGIYEMRFRDVKKRRFAKYRSFHFPEEDKNYYKLKKMVLGGFDNVPEEPVSVEFVEENVELEFTKSAGMTSFRFVLIEGKKDKRIYSSWLSKGKAEKIFGI